MVVRQVQRVTRFRTAGPRSRPRTASPPARTGPHVGPPSARFARSASGARYASVPTISVAWVKPGRSSGTDVASAKVDQGRGASPETTTLAGLMSRCITPRRCIPATALANAVASPITSSIASRSASSARLAVPASASAIESGYRGRSASSATPSTQRSRSRIPVPRRRRRPLAAATAVYGSPCARERTTGSPACDRVRRRFRPLGRSRPATPGLPPSVPPRAVGLGSPRPYVHLLGNGGPATPPRHRAGARHDRRPGAIGAADMRIRDVTGLS